MKDLIKKAMDLAENEVQDKQIQHLKNIIKSLLQKKVDKEKEKDELDEEIKLIKQDIDDFKAGRIDKIKERHELNEKADKILPINITIINDNSRINYPTQPWRWNYEIITNFDVNNPHYFHSTGGNNAIMLCGSTSATYTAGTYSVSNTFGSGIINL